MTVGYYSLCSESIERETGFEPATSSLARKCSTTEPLPHGDLLQDAKQWAMRDSNSHGSSPTDPKSVLSTSFSNRPLFSDLGRVIPFVDNTLLTSLLSRQLCFRLPPFPHKDGVLHFLNHLAGEDPDQHGI